MKTLRLKQNLKGYIGMTELLQWQRTPRLKVKAAWRRMQMEERSCGERNWHGCNIKFGHCATTPKEHFRGTRIANRWNSCKPSVRRSFFSPRRHQSGARKTKLSSDLGLFNRTTAFAGSNRRSYILRLILPNFLGHRRNLRIVVSESGEVS